MDSRWWGVNVQEVQTTFFISCPRLSERAAELMKSWFTISSHAPKLHGWVHKHPAYGGDSAGHLVRRSTKDPHTYPGLQVLTSTEPQPTLS